MSIISHQIIEDSPQADDKRHLRYEFVDHLDVAYRYIFKRVPAVFDADADRLAMVSVIEAELAKRELEEMIVRFETGNNPLRDAQDKIINPKHQDRALVVQKLLKHFTQLKADVIRAKAAQFDDIRVELNRG